MKLLRITKRATIFKSKVYFLRAKQLDGGVVLAIRDAKNACKRPLAEKYGFFKTTLERV